MIFLVTCIQGSNLITGLPVAIQSKNGVGFFFPVFSVRNYNSCTIILV